jgi:predicted oxidoreductase (fatty acid repression mutant protein)|tara:strand:- start:1194 stop:2219 length:1026 start_codon:yes stop_codon:yes gene_type:complete
MNILNAIKEEIKTEFSTQTLYPNKTVDLLPYCDKNIPLVLEAYKLDLAEGGSRHTKMVISQHYAGNRRQTKNIDLSVELWIHEHIVELLSNGNLNNLEKSHIMHLFNMWKEVFTENNYVENQGFLENLVLNRASYTTFENEKIDNVKISKILNAANGLTPSLSNNYHYRVDVLPDSVKQVMWPHMHSYFDGCSEEVKNAFERDHTIHTMEEWKKAGVCFNTQFDAPLVLAYSVPAPIDNTHKYWTTSDFPTSRDATMISLGTNMWNAICTVEELGLNSCCLRAYNTDKISNIVSLSSKEEMPEGWKWEPFIFLCVGKGKKLKGDHRKYKPKGIVNSLTFEV